MRAARELVDAPTATAPIATNVFVPVRLCVDAAGFARLIGVSVRQVYRLRDAGRLPAPIEFGGCVRWSLREIEAWIAAGAPRRREWEAMRNSACAPLR
jgi:predicted DNA-binding transcriptional regulator AlpA